jgi:hypothetical protein
VKLPRRAPREVYRVYDENEFMAAAGSELSAAHSGVNGSIGLVGVAALVVGAVAVFGGLFTSGRRLQRGESAARGRASRTASAIGALLVKAPEARGSVKRPANGSRASRTMTRRLALAPRRPRPRLNRADAPRSVVEAPRALPIAASQVGYARPAEFGFER